MTRECHVQFCERLGVKLPGATLPSATLAFNVPAIKIIEWIVVFACRTAIMISTL